MSVAQAHSQALPTKERGRALRLMYGERLLVYIHGLPLVMLLGPVAHMWRQNLLCELTLCISLLLGCTSSSWYSLFLSFSHLMQLSLLEVG